MSKINSAVESVMDLIDAMNTGFPPVTRGALGTDAGISCEIAPSNASEVYMDKNSYLIITLALNAKHADLQTLSDTLNDIIDSLTRRTEYPEGNGWKIVDISYGILPRVIDREQNGLWLAACDLTIKIYRKDDE